MAIATILPRTVRGLSQAAVLALGCLSASAWADGKWVQDTKSCAAPSYPKESLSRREEGTTALRILVGADGKVIDSEVESSSRSRKLDEAARRALSECSYKPVPADAKPGQQWVAVRFDWKLD